MPIVIILIDESKAREWDNLLTCHVGDTKARTWSTQRKAIGKHNFEAQDKSIIKSVQISACGNFGFIGTHSGLIEKYNMQSGLLRGATKAHISEVSCMVSDNVNLNFISGSLDGTVNIWDFNQFVLLKTIDLKSPITNMCIHQEAGIIAVVTDNLKISVIDIDTHKLVREFKGHTNRITGISFSPDGRWIVSSSLDQTIRTWDLPTGFLIDAFRVPDICTSVSMSPSGDFIATTHVNQLGIFLWSNKSLYSYVPLRPLSEKDVKELMLPTAGGTETHDIEVDESVVPDMDIDDVWQPLDQNLITLSTQPKSKWQNLLNLDTIKVNINN